MRAGAAFQKNNGKDQGSQPRQPNKGSPSRRLKQLAVCLGKVNVPYSCTEYGFPKPVLHLQTPPVHFLLIFQISRCVQSAQSRRRYVRHHEFYYTYSTGIFAGRFETEYLCCTSFRLIVTFWVALVCSLSGQNGRLYLVSGDIQQHGPVHRPDPACYVGGGFVRGEFSIVCGVRTRDLSIERPTRYPVG